MKKVLSDTDHCEWEYRNGKQCTKPTAFDCSLIGSNSAANIWFMCTLHAKHYRNKRFVEFTFGKGAKVELRKH